MAELVLDAQPRTLTGRKVRQLRTQGLVPVVVYGSNTEPKNLQVSARELARTLQHGGFSQLVQVKVAGGGEHNILIREVQRHPVSHAYLHADFYAVNLREKQEVSVPLVTVGKPLALVTGMMVLQAMDVAHIRALPADIPAVIEIDITGLDLENPITVENLPAVRGVEYLDEPSEYVVSLIETREEAEEEPVADLAEPELVGRDREDADAEE